MYIQMLRLWLGLLSGCEALGTRLARPQRGAAMVEYGLVIGLIAIVAMTAVKFLGTTVASVFQNIAGHIASAGA
jgi:Flp pilus assembly pilin Flp